MSFTFNREEFDRFPKTLLRDGRWANAVVWRVDTPEGSFTVKDFSTRKRWVRFTIGRFVLRRERRALERLHGIPGISPEVFKVDGNALAVRFVEGHSLAKAHRNEVTPAFLDELEALLAAMHAQHIVHLDCRGVGNVLVTPDGHPALIDFQSALYTRFLPKFIRRFLERLDDSAVLKFWDQFRRDEMSPEKRAQFEKMERWRKLWIIRGYFGN